MFMHHLIKRSLAGGLVIAAAGFPAVAQARLSVDPPAGSGPPITSTASVPVTPSAGSSFQWGDAGIGAAGTILLLGAGAGAAGAVRRRRTHRVVAG
jgi:hypothetical protein